MNYNVDAIKSMYPKGTRLELTEINDKYTKLKRGDQGVIECVDDIGTIHVNWDNGSSLGIILGEDTFKVLPPPQTDLIETIADYIISEVANDSESSMSGFQSTVYYGDILSSYACAIEEYVQNLILDELLSRNEVADAIVDTDGFDVVLYTEYAPNYTGVED